VQIVCSQCQAEYEIDPPVAPFGRLQNLVFRCTACGVSIPIRDEASNSTAKEAVESPAKFVLQQNGKTYNVKDSATMQRWIAERRVSVDDTVSVDGGSYQPIGELEEFGVFFKLVSDADRSTQATEAFRDPPKETPDRLPRDADSGENSIRKTMKPKGKSLFARPAGLASGGASESIGAPVSDAPDAVSTPTDFEAIEQSPASTVEPSAYADTLNGLEFGAGMADAPSDDAESLSMDPAHDAVAVTVEEWELGEALPDDSGTVDVQSSSAQDGIGMDFDEEDFFSEEQASLAVSSLDDDDDELDWDQKRGSNMLVWWLLFLGALAGSGYAALEWLNQADESSASAASKEVPDAEEVAPLTVPTDVQQVETAREAQEDQPAVPTDAVEEVIPPAVNAQTEEDPVPEDKRSPSDAATDAPESAKTAPVASAKTKKPVPPKPSASSETDRGWSKIDRGDFEAARTHFNAALAANGSYADARFGLAYVNEKQGRVDEAVRQYCRLSSNSSGSVKNEADGRLRSLDRTCP